MKLMSDGKLAKIMRAEGRHKPNEEEQEMRRKRDEIIGVVVSIVVSIMGSVGTILLLRGWL